MGKRLMLLSTAVIALGASCRGGPSDAPPLHWQRNMFTQDKGKPQRENPFFADHRVSRPPVEGTVSRTMPIEDDAFTTGKEDGAYVKDIPVRLTKEMMQRGQERYGIYCSPCHDQVGGGEGIVIKRAAGAIVKPPSYHDDERVRNLPAGEIFAAISNGVRTMPSYSYQVPADDRWAIVAYVKALQRSQRATLADVPTDKRGELK